MDLSNLSQAELNKVARRLNAYDRYVAFILGERESPEPQQDGDLTTSSWQYELVSRRWPTARFLQGIEAAARNRYIQQRIGPVTLLPRRGAS